MELEKAIEELELGVDVAKMRGATKLVDALQLGIEAIKRVKTYKEAHIYLHYHPMPGETEN